VPLFTAMREKKKLKFASSGVNEKIENQCKLGRRRKFNDTPEKLRNFRGIKGGRASIFAVSSSFEVIEFKGIERSCAE
jgi:hypothetical protein